MSHVRKPTARVARPALALALLAASVLPARAQEAAVAGPSAAPAAALAPSSSVAVRRAHGLLPSPRFAPQLELLARTAPTPAADRERARVTPGEAFRAELRDEAIEYRFTNRWAFADENLQGDRPVREGRARAAERMLGDAAGAGLEILLRDALDRPKRRSDAPEPRGVRQRLRLDSSPAWRLSGRAGLNSLRLDLPLTAHDELHLRFSRPLAGARWERGVGGSMRLDPWEGSLRFGFELEY